MIVTKLPDFENLPDVISNLTDAEAIELLYNVLHSTTATLEQERPLLSKSSAIVGLNEKVVDYNNALLRLVAEKFNLV